MSSVQTPVSMSSQSKRNLTAEIQRCRAFGMPPSKSPHVKRLKRQVVLDEEAEHPWKGKLAEGLRWVALALLILAAYLWLKVINGLFSLIQLR